MLVKGLVVVPDFYLNGIEATNYEILGETDVLETKTFDVATPLPGETYGSNTTTAIFAAGQPESTPVDGTAYPWGSPYGVNSISTIEYRLNPNNANIDKVDWEAIFENYQVLSTKAAATSLLSAKKNAAGNLEVTYQLAQGSRIAPWAANTSLWGPRDKDNAAWTLMALLAQLTNSDSALVTSDNVAIVESNVTFGDLVVDKNNVPKTANVIAVAENAAEIAKAAYTDNNADPTVTPVLAVPFNATFNLSEHLFIETSTITPLVQETLTNGVPSGNLATGQTAVESFINLKEANEIWGLTPNFQIVNYTVSGQPTAVYL